MDTVIARYGDDYTEYTSGIKFARCESIEQHIRALREALDLALEKGYK